MKISTKGRYALRVMLDLAANSKGGEYVSLAEISERQEVSLKYLEAIVAALSKAGFLDSRRGKTGGYRLAKDAADYTVGGILKATEGSLAPVSCLDCEESCSRAAHCLTLPLWKELDSRIDGYLESVTLGDILKGEVGEKSAGKENF